MLPVLSMIANNFSSYGLVKSEFTFNKRGYRWIQNRSKEKRRNDVICCCWKADWNMRRLFLFLQTSHSFPIRELVHPCSSISLWFSRKRVVSTPYNTDIELAHRACTEQWSVSRSNISLGCSLPFSLCRGTEERVLFLLRAPEWKRLGAGPKRTHSQQNRVQNES